jgi:uncharacterized protein YbjT (DUF2867 family)
MKITVMGATGQSGKKVVALLNDAGHETVAASRGSGADVLTGAGLANAMAGADVLVDVTNSPSFEDDPVMQFFTTSATNLVASAKEAGVGHFVLLSIVGADGLPDSGYLRAKVAQERIVTESGLPYTIVRATQFHEFTERITASMTGNGEVRVPDALIQPIAADAVAAEVTRAALTTPANGIVNVGGPDKLAFAEMAALIIAAHGEDTPVAVDPSATYFGTPLQETSLVTDTDAVIAGSRFADWLAAR